MSATIQASTSTISRNFWRASHLPLVGLTILTDLLPPRIRFGHWRRVLQVLSPRIEMVSVDRPQTDSSAEIGTEFHPGADDPDMSCLIVAGSMDHGGVETVVSMLARGLPAHRISVEVVCTRPGNVAEDLVRDGVKVSTVTSDDLTEYIRSRSPDVVQIHRVDPELTDAVEASGARVVPVFHAFESYLNSAGWDSLRRMVARSPFGVSVSAGVRDFFLDHLPELNNIQVIVNCSPLKSPEDVARDDARHTLAKALGIDLAQDTIVLSLMRFCDQKNAAGLVDAFLLSSESRSDTRLVIAGAPDNWLEVRRADSLRKNHPNGGRVHFLNDSDAPALLSAADVFALDSFAEGGPIAAVEAASYGLPLVLSDVGFAKELVNCEGVHGIVVPRANATSSTRSIAQQRRRRHQSNRKAFADAIDAMSRLPRVRGIELKEFSLETMVASHARTLYSAAGNADQ